MNELLLILRNSKLLLSFHSFIIGFLFIFCFKAQKLMLRLVSLVLIHIAKHKEYKKMIIIKICRRKHK